MVDSEDKRDFRRMTIDCEVAVRSAMQNETFSGQGTDLSATGLQFSTDHAVSVGEQLEVEIQPGRAGTTLPLHAMVEVVHVEQNGDQNSVGCKIIKML